MYFILNNGNSNNIRRQGGQGPRGQEARAQEGGGRQVRGLRPRQEGRPQGARGQGAEGPEEGRQGHPWHQGQEGQDLGPVPQAQDVQARQAAKVPQEGHPQEEQVRTTESIIMGITALVMIH